MLLQKWVVPAIILAVMVALVVAAVCLFLLVHYGLESEHGSKLNKCVEFCKSPPQGNYYCWGFKEGSFSKQTVASMCQFVSASRTKKDDFQCFAFSRDGCLQPESKHCPLTGESRDPSCPPPQFQDYFKNKFLEVLHANTVNTFLNQSAFTYMFENSSALSVIEEQFAKAHIFTQNTTTFLDDYNTELSDSLDYYFSFMWKDPPGMYLQYLFFNQ